MPGMFGSTAENKNSNFIELTAFLKPLRSVLKTVGVFLLKNKKSSIFGKDKMKKIVLNRDLQ
jgi:hypothetical protein